MKPINPNNIEEDPVYIRLWDSHQDNIIYQEFIYDQNLRGLFQSSAFSFCGNHLYYKNCVVKIRTDLMNLRNMLESQLFTQYNNIFEIESGFKVKINSPL